MKPQTETSELPEATGCGRSPSESRIQRQGVGVVVLRLVVYGFVAKHASLNVLPASKTARVRSIQKHDDR